MDSLKKKAQDMASKFTMKSAMVEMGKRMLPGIEKMISEGLTNMENPDHEEFALPEGFHKVSYSVVSDGERLLISLHSLKVNEDGTATMSEPMKTFYLTDLIEMHANG